MKKRAYEILYEDPHLVVVDKSSSVLTVPDRFDHKTQNLKSLLRNRYGQIFPVHRLDKDTSGVVLFAKTETAHKRMSALFQEANILKEYLAICEGQMSQENLEIKEPIREDPQKRGKYMVHPTGKPSVTQVMVLEKFRNYSVLGIRILTGRTHQIRVHLQYLGHALLADPIYSPSNAFYVSSVKGGRFNLGRGKEEQPLLKRQALHSISLEFVHPFQDEKLQIKAELPKDLKACIHQLRKWNAPSEYNSESYD